jgi:hypothetical protein
MSGALVHNVMHFARVLRTAGIPVGTDRIQLALQALDVAGVGPREDFHDVLSACWLDRREQRPLFDSAFELFWRDPDLAGKMMSLLLPRVQSQSALLKAREHRRLAAALYPHAPQPQRPRADDEPPPPLELEVALSASERERLQRADFDTMSPEEWQAARRAIADMKPLFAPLRTRRWQRSPSGSIDPRATLRAMARQGGELPAFVFRRRRVRPAPMVVLADISGSMSRYSRMLLHFVHTLSQAGARVESFVFGTRLTHITRLLQQRDPDQAVDQVSGHVPDWSGGTRLAESLHAFNRHWSRRVLDSRATVLLISDGLAHGDTASLGFEAERLRKSCARLVWLNPLLRAPGFEPRAAGMRALRPHVDRFVPAHNLASLAQLVALLAEPASARWN